MPRWDAAECYGSDAAKKIHQESIFAFEWIKLPNCAISVKLYTEDRGFHYVGGFMRSNSDSYFIIWIHQHRLPRETSADKSVQAIVVTLGSVTV